MITFTAYIQLKYLIFNCLQFLHYVLRNDRGSLYFGVKIFRDPVSVNSHEHMLQEETFSFNLMFLSSLTVTILLKCEKLLC